MWKGCLLLCECDHKRRHQAARRQSKKTPLTLRSRRTSWSRRTGRTRLACVFFFWGGGGLVRLRHPSVFSPSPAVSSTHTLRPDRALRPNRTWRAVARARVVVGLALFARRRRARLSKQAAAHARRWWWQARAVGGERGDNDDGDAGRGDPRQKQRAAAARHRRQSSSPPVLPREEPGLAKGARTVFLDPRAFSNFRAVIFDPAGMMVGVQQQGGKSA